MSTPRSRWLFLSATPAPLTLTALGEKRLAGTSSPATPTAADASRRRLLYELVQARSARRLARSNTTPDAPPCSTVSSLRTPLVEQIRPLTSQIAGAVRAHADGGIFLSLFRDPKSVVTAATLLAEIGDNRNRYTTSDSLDAIAGQAPVAVQSGKQQHRQLPLGQHKPSATPPSACSPTPPATSTPGLTRSTNAPASAATTTPTRSASSAAPGTESSGASGKTNTLDPNRHGSLNRLQAARGSHTGRLISGPGEVTS